MVGSVDKFDRQQWKTMQQTMNDSLKFVDILHNVPWEDGIPEDVLLGRRTITNHNLMSRALISTVIVLCKQFSTET